MNEAELLFSSILDCDRLSLYLNRESLLDKKSSINISSVLKRRINGEPIQYIMGKTEFMGFEFKVTPDVLIPRPETEILVEEVINKVRAQASPKGTKSERKPPRRGQSQSASLPEGDKVTRVLDVGTGSGNIAISLARLLQNIDITAIDISGKAIEIALKNAALNNVLEKIKFIESDLFTSNMLRDKFYDIIVSNPPYIASGEIDKLQPEIEYEPRLALDGGIDGLDFYRKLVTNSLQYLKKYGLIIMEIGFNQAPALKNIFQKYKDFEIIELVKDYNNIERVIVVRRKRENG